MAGSKNTRSTLTTREWLKQQLLIREPSQRDPKFTKLYSKLMDDARELAAGMAARFDIDERASPTLARDDPWARALRADQMFLEIAERAMLDRTEESTLYIRELVLNHPGRTAKELRKMASDSVVGDMTLHTFEKKVSDAKKLLVAK
jgi:hypothetical protein